MNVRDKLKEFKKQVEPYKNTLVIDEFLNVVRLVDVIYDMEDEEFYWVLDDSEDIGYLSCLASWTPLKGFIPDDKYTDLVYTWNMNTENQVQ